MSPPKPANKNPIAIMIHETIDDLSIGDTDDFLDFDQLSEHLIKHAAAANNDKDVDDLVGDAEDEGDCFESSSKSTHLP